MAHQMVGAGVMLEVGPASLPCMLLTGQARGSRSR
jgi:hypothetical protein